MKTYSISDQLNKFRAFLSLLTYIYNVILDLKYDASASEVRENSTNAKQPTPFLVIVAVNTQRNHKNPFSKASLFG